jgi:xylulose-5-phosphate/fructose-6-phosphate phosphoketolase
MRTATRIDEPPQYDSALSAYGRARSTVEGAPLTPDEVRKIDAYWRASLYLCLGMLYLKANPLLREPLTLEHIKPRLLGHWGSGLYLHPFQPSDQKIRPQRYLY